MMSRRAQCAVDVQCEEKAPCAKSKTRDDTTACGAPAADATCCATPAPVGAPEAVGGTHHETVMFVTTTASPEAMAKLYVAPTAVAVCPVKRPAECKCVDQCRRMTWTWDFTLGQMKDKVRPAVTADVDHYSRTKLAPGGDQVTTMKTLEAPRYIIPTDVTLLQTSNNCPFPLVAKADWIGTRSLLLNSGQCGTFYVPESTAKTCGAKEGRLHVLQKDVLDMIKKRLFLIECDPTSFHEDYVRDDTNGFVTVKQNTPFANAFAEYLDTHPLPSEFQAITFDEQLQNMKNDIALIKMLVVSPSMMSISLEAVRPTSDQVKLEDLLVKKLGANPERYPSRWQMYWDKGNHVSVSLEVAYVALV